MFKFTSKEIERKNTLATVAGGDKIFLCAGRPPEVTYGRVPFVSKRNDIDNHEMFRRVGFNQCVYGIFPFFGDNGLYTAQVQGTQAAILILTLSTDNTYAEYLLYHAPAPDGFSAEAIAMMKALKVPEVMHMVIMVNNENSGPIFDGYVHVLTSIFGNHFDAAKVLQWETLWDNFAVVLADFGHDTPIGSVGHVSAPKASVVNTPATKDTDTKTKPADTKTKTTATNTGSDSDTEGEYESDSEYCYIAESEDDEGDAQFYDPKAKEEDFLPPTDDPDEAIIPGSGYGIIIYDDPTKGKEGKVAKPYDKGIDADEHRGPLVLQLLMYKESALLNVRFYRSVRDQYFRQPFDSYHEGDLGWLIKTKRPWAQAEGKPFAIKDPSLKVLQKSLVSGQWYGTTTLTAPIVAPFWLFGREQPNGKWSASTVCVFAFVKQAGKYTQFQYRELHVINKNGVNTVIDPLKPSALALGVDDEKEVLIVCKSENDETVLQQSIALIDQKIFARGIRNVKTICWVVAAESMLISIFTTKVKFGCNLMSWANRRRTVTQGSTDFRTQKILGSATSKQIYRGSIWQPDQAVTTLSINNIAPPEVLAEVAQQTDQCTGVFKVTLNDALAQSFGINTVVCTTKLNNQSIVYIIAEQGGFERLKKELKITIYHTSYDLIIKNKQVQPLKKETEQAILSVVRRPEMCNLLIVKLGMGSLTDEMMLEDAYKVLDQALPHGVISIARTTLLTTIDPNFAFCIASQIFHEAAGHPVGSYGSLLPPTAEIKPIIKPDKFGNCVIQ